jgi:HK97 gp10 family phage protein
MKGYCPVLTGALRDSISSTVDDSGSTVVGSVGPHMDYAAYVEYGTGVRGASSAGAGPYAYNPNWPGMAAHPYVRPSLDECKPTVLDMFRSQIVTALA